ncbi:MAG: transcriptional regulator [Ruminococcaceae bacterium]|nr:transcriptional regulator [Oscillospiraceae bacterium]
MSDRLIPAAPWLAGLFFGFIFLLILRRPLARLWRLFIRSAGGLAALALLSKSGGLLGGICLGVNWLNALVLGLLGLPGFGLLLMLRWVLQTP